MNRDTPQISTSSAARRKSNRFRSRSLEVAATALGASALADNASATIIYDLALNAAPGTSFFIDGSATGEISVISMVMAMGAVVDLSLRAPAAMGMDPGSTAQLSVFSSGGTDYLNFLNAGATVDASLGSFASEAFMRDDPITNPTWTPGVTGYAGFVFDNAGTLNYGWMQVQFDISGTNFTVLQFAYDDTGNSIDAGLIPEPGTAILLGLGLACLAGLFRKRGRTRLVDGTT